MNHDTIVFISMEMFVRQFEIRGYNFISRSWRRFECGSTVNCVYMQLSA